MDLSDYLITPKGLFYKGDHSESLSFVGLTESPLFDEFITMMDDPEVSEAYLMDSVDLFIWFEHGII